LTCLFAAWLFSFVSYSISWKRVVTLPSNLPDLNGRSGPLCILFLEDDALLRDRVLVPKLRQFGFEVMTAGRATEMYEAISKRLPDIILLDVGLPDGNGFDVARQLRAEYAGIGIVMLTGRLGNANVVQGLSEGADAYLSKPVEIDVLVATILSVARRLGSLAPNEPRTWRLSSNGWSLVSPRGGRVRLSYTERCLLGALMRQPNEVVSRETLIAALTDDTVGFDPHRVDALIYRLRRKILANLGEMLPLNVVHGIGFVLSTEPG
jgi:DNA-binding response OmpR family regulator